jgi:phosphoribosylanthranilate isomerase
VPVKVKICGVTSEADARAAVAAGADYVGLNFVPTSPRLVPVDRAVRIARAAEGAAVVAVFADADGDEARRIADAIDADLVQLHGVEPPEYCRGWERPVIKALRAPDAGALVALAARYDEVAYLLVDAWAPGRLGGTGVPLDLDVASALDAGRLFVAGGLDAERVAVVVARLRPYAVDVASGVESRPGVKDHGEIARFVRCAKAA